MIIHFDVTEDDGDRTLHIEGTNILVGEIVKGRAMVGSRGTWTEWAFIDANGNQGETRRNISAAYSDARAFAATLPTTTTGG